MNRAFLLAAVLFSLLLSAVHSPAVAHDVDAGHSHSEHSDGLTESAQPDTEADDEQDDTVKHQHCLNGWCPHDLKEVGESSDVRALIFPVTHHALTSLAQAPPIQPPSA